MAPAREIRSLNTIRGVAALMVAIYHGSYLFGDALSLPHAYLAVDLFFVLSGFVMLHAYGAKIEGGLAYGRFTQLRLARLWPLLALATLAGAGVWIARLMTNALEFNWATMIALPLNLLMLPASEAADSNHAAYPFAMQSWSILWEVGLSLMLFAWIRWVRKGALLIAIAAGALLLFLAMKNNTLDGGWQTQNFWVGGARALFAFWAGVVVRQWTLEKKESRLLNSAAVGAVAAVLFYVWRIHPTYWWADYAAVTVAFPLILAAAALTRSRLLENRFGDVLGEASYSVYLLHLVSLQLILSFFGAGPNGASTAGHWIMGVSWLVVLVALSWLSWRWVETPLRKLFSRPFSLRPTVAASQAA